MKEEGFYLLHIVQCIEKIERYTQTEKSTFLTDTKTQDVLIHQYDGIDPVEVWLTVEQDLPILKAAIANLLLTLPPTAE